MSTATALPDGLGPWAAQQLIFDVGYGLGRGLGWGFTNWGGAAAHARGSWAAGAHLEARHDAGAGRQRQQLQLHAAHPPHRRQIVVHQQVVGLVVEACGAQGRTVRGLRVTARQPDRQPASSGREAGCTSCLACRPPQQLQRRATTAPVCDPNPVPTLTLRFPTGRWSPLQQEHKNCGQPAAAALQFSPSPNRTAPRAHPTGR